jgi:predicted DNA-binding protein
MFVSQDAMTLAVRLSEQTKGRLEALAARTGGARPCMHAAIKAHLADLESP